MRDFFIVFYALHGGANFCILILRIGIAKFAYLAIVWYNIGEEITKRNFLKG